MPSLGLCALVLTLTSADSAIGQPPALIFSRLQVRHSGQCLDISGASLALLQQFPCHGGWNQQFLFLPAGGPDYFALVRQSGQVLDVVGGSLNPGTRVRQFPLSGGDNQKWSFVSAGDEWYTVHARHSGQCIAIEGGSMNPGANAEQRPCDGGWSQQFRIIGV